jgi:chromosome partitioning protein
MRNPLAEDHFNLYTQLKPGNIIAISVVKGGAGKTASAVNIASGLALWGVNFGWRVLLVDTDPQSTAANAVGKYNPISQTKNLAMLLDDDQQQLRPHEYVVPSPWYPQNLHFIPTNLQSMGSMREKMLSKLGRERRLARILKSLASDYHFVIIDTGPSNDVLTQNALVAADYVITPINLDFLGLEAITRTLQMIKEVQIGLDQETPQILGLLGTFYRKGILASEDSLQLLQEKFQSALFETVIPLNASLPDSFSAGTDIFSYDKYSPGAKAYGSLVQEIIHRVNQFQQS